MSIRISPIGNFLFTFGDNIYIINLLRLIQEVLHMAATNDRIKELRLQLGYPVDEFARMLGIHRSSVYRYEGENEKEARDVPISIAILISKKFNVSLDWLAGVSNSMYLDQSSNELTELYETLSEENKKELFSYARYLKAKQ